MSFISESAAAAAGILAEISASTDAYAAKSQLRCREGCGQCCLKPGIEAQVVELLPLAQALLSDGTADSWYEKAASDPGGRCLFYAPQAGDETLGRCTVYALRPSLCRLFGFAAVSGKEAKAPVLAACHWHKKLIPETVAAAQAAICEGGEVPLFSEFSLRLNMVAPTASLNARLPINEALMRAIEKLSLEGGA